MQLSEINCIFAPIIATLNMKKSHLSFAVMLMGSTLLTGCLDSDNNNDNPIVTEYVVTHGALIVNNGSSYSGIDGSLTCLDYYDGTARQNVFKNANGMSLGGTPNAVLVYGDKVYVAGSDENAVFVLNKKTFKLIERISTTDEMGEEEGVTPRYLTSYKSNVYVSTYGGYVGVIDTLSLSVHNMYKVGSYPEGMAIGTKDDVPFLYVANSDYGYGNGSISIINLLSGAVSEFKDGQIHYPQELAVAGDYIYVLDWGYYDENWVQKEAGVYLINGSSVQKIIPDATGMAVAGNIILTFNAPYNSDKQTTYSVFNIAAGTLNPFILSDDSSNPIFSPAAISIDPNTGYVLIASRTKNEDTGYPDYAAPGFVNMYTSNGQYVKTLATGVEPHQIAYLYGMAKLQ